MNHRPAFPLVFSALATFALACGDGTSSDTTSGKRITFDVRVAQAPKTFTSKQGWEVSLTKAQLSTGALYFYDGEILFSFAPKSRLSPLDVLLGSKVAYAHPGHYVPGESKGQFLTPSSVDLLSPGNALGTGEGVSGVVRSATFSFGSPPAGPLASALGSHLVVLEGTGKKGAETRSFVAEIGAVDLLDSKGKPQIEGCPFTEANAQGDGKVTLTVDVPAWFDQVELELLPATPAPAKMADVPKAQLVRSMKGADRYRFAFTPR
jgi:hypothetical protein